MEKLFSYLFLPLALLVIVMQAWHPAWYPHISTDVYVYYNRASYFLTHGNLTGADTNEHLPGAILLFLSAIPSLWVDNSFESYIRGFLTVNLILLLLIAISYLFYKRSANIVIYAVILLMTGPIMFFRFDLLVVLFTIISFYLWQTKKEIWSTVLLAVATLVKIYPIIFLPYYLILAYKEKGLSQVFILLATYIFTGYFLLATYLLSFQIPLQNFLFSLNFHALKPVHTESIWVDFFNYYYYLTQGHFPKVISAWGINGIASEYWIFPLSFYNWIWVLPVGLVYLWIFLKLKRHKFNFDIRVCLLVVFIFLVFSKVLSHQYLLWFFLLIPLLPKHVLFSKVWIINTFLVLFITFFYQNIYPLNYSQFLDSFSDPSKDWHLFAINSAAHFLMIVLLIRQFIDLKRYINE